MIRWQSRGQSCIKPSIPTFLREVAGRVIALSVGPMIAMSFSLPDFRRIWSCRGYMSAGAAMVTAALGLSLVLTERAEARKYNTPLDIFGNAAPRPRAAVHSARIPLPKPRPEEAPKAPEQAPAEGEGQPSPD